MIQPAAVAALRPAVVTNHMQSLSEAQQSLLTVGRGAAWRGGRARRAPRAPLHAAAAVLRVPRAASPARMHGGAAPQHGASTRPPRALPRPPRPRGPPPMAPRRRSTRPRRRRWRRPSSTAASAPPSRWQACAPRWCSSRRRATRWRATPTRWGGWRRSTRRRCRGRPTLTRPRRRPCSGAGGARPRRGWRAQGRGQGSQRRGLPARARRWRQRTGAPAPAGAAHRPPSCLPGSPPSARQVQPQHVRHPARVRRQRTAGAWRRRRQRRRRRRRRR
jgi:hypothetical protein